MVTDPNLLKYTYEHYVHFPSDGKRHEIVDGEHFVNPAPSTKHQYALHQIHYQLYEQIEKRGSGIIFGAPIDVQLSEFTVVQPDLMVILNDRREIISDPKIDGPPNMVAEVVSPSSPKYDRTTKKKAYQVAGVPEYWIIDPIQRSIDQFVLADQQYQLQQHDGVEIALTILPDVTVTVDKLWFSA